jgi:hypothetical protein
MSSAARRRLISLLAGAGVLAAAGGGFAFVQASGGGDARAAVLAGRDGPAVPDGLFRPIMAMPRYTPPAASRRTRARTEAADYAVRHASGRTMPLALDIEYNPYGRECYGLTAARMVGWLAAFTGEVRRLTGHRPVIYSTADWWRSCTGDSRAFGADPLWVAAWGTASPPMPSGWRNWTFWQYTSRGRVPGIKGNVDVSYYRRRLPAPPAGSPSPMPSSPSPVPSSPSPVPSSPSPVPSSPSPVPSSPSPVPSSPSPVPSSPSPVPSSPSPVPSSPSPTPSSPSPVPSGPSATPSSPVQSAGSQPRH